MAERSHVRNERSLVPILRCDRDLPVTALTIERREDSGVSEGIGAVIHTRKWVRIGDRLCVKTSVIDIEPQRTVFLGHEHHGACLKRSKNVVGNFSKDPETYIKKKKKGRPTKVSPRWAAAGHHKLSAGFSNIIGVKRDINVTFSGSTILRAAHKGHVLEWKRMRKALQMTALHKTFLLEWAMDNVKLYREEWRNIIFSAEKKFNFDVPDGNAYYWHHLRPNERIISTKTFEGG